MSKKIIIFVLSVLIFIFFLLFILPYIRIQKGITLYNNSDFTGAQLQFFSSNFPDIKQESLYNIGTTLYKQKNYTGAFLYFMSTSSGNLEINALHNLGNTAYLLGATKDNTDEKLSLWNQSLGFYSGALDKKELAETRENYEYVKKQIQALQNTEEKEQTSSEQEKDTGQKEQKNSSQTGSSSKKSQSSSQRDSQYQLKQGDAKGELSQSEKEYLEGYKQYLEEFQKQNSQFYNKKPSSQEGGDIFENFMNPFTGEPLFQNNFNQSEKDR